jgi:hypothetical protein
MKARRSHTSPTSESKVPARHSKQSKVLRQLFAEQSALGGPSLWDRIKDLVIDDDRLPRDLSSNPKYLKGYGRSRTR